MREREGALVRLVPVTVLLCCFVASLIRCFFFLFVLLRTVRHGSASLGAPDLWAQVGPLAPWREAEDALGFAALRGVARDNLVAFLDAGDSLANLERERMGGRGWSREPSGGGGGGGMAKARRRNHVNTNSTSPTHTWPSHRPCKPSPRDHATTRPRDHPRRRDLVA